MAEDKPLPLQGQAIARREEARQWKQRRLLDFKECYFFAAPSRQRQLSSQTAPSTQTMLDEPELNTDLAFLLCADATTEITQTFMPEAQNWCERAAGMDVPQEAFDQVSDEVRTGDKKIFGAIRASNLYAEIPKAFNPDLLIAGAGLHIDRPAAHKPIRVLAVPMREIEINLGPDGEIDDRFIIRFARNVYVESLLGPDIWAKVDAETKKAIADKPDGRTEICWGYWRKWDRLDDEVWQHIVLLGNKLVHEAELVGEGSCPFLVMRFNPSADWPWAIGPLIQGLPTLRQVDEWERQIPEAVERATNPAIKYPDDGVTNIEQGLEPGMGYPYRPGSGEGFGPIYQQPSIDPALGDLDRKEHRLKKLFFVDHPEQTGDTPPTLGQWLDELARMQRRIGTAGYSFWREGPMRIFLRFKFLLEKSGTIKAVADKSGRMISTQPYNPTQRAAEQQEIATAVQCGQILGQMFPEEFKLWIDGKSSMKAIIDKMRTSGLLKLRDEGQVAQALGRIKQLVAGRERPGEPSAQSPALTQGAGAPAAA